MAAILRPIATPAKKIVTVCASCYDAEEQTANARAHGFDVTYEDCAACTARRETSAKKVGESS